MNHPLCNFIHDTTRDQNNPHELIRIWNLDVSHHPEKAALAMPMPALKALVSPIEIALSTRDNYQK